MEQELRDELLRTAAIIPAFDPSRNYWLVRTNGGEFYEDFYLSETIGIGYNNVTISDTKAAAIGKKKGRKVLVEKARELYPDAAQPGYIVGQVSRFVFDMSVGDIIMIPDRASRNMTFGEILGEAFELGGKGNWDDSKGITTFRKRRKVRWIKTKSRFKLDANLQTFTHNQHIITNITDKADYIDRELFPIYRKGGKTYAQINVGIQHALHGKDLFQFGASLFALTDELLEDAELQGTTDEMEVKTKIQSEGYIELIHENGALVLGAVSLVAWLLLGGRIKGAYDGTKLDFEASADGGLMRQISEFLDRWEDRKLRKAARKALMKKVESAGERMEVSTHIEILRLASGNAPPPKQILPPAPEDSKETGTQEQV